MNKKAVWWVVGIIIVAIIIAVANQKQSDTSIIKIGFVGPLTGDAAVYGITEKNATEMALAQVNSAGGINGRQLQVIYEDGKGTGKDATTAAQKLISVDGVKFILGGVFSSETLSIAPVAEQAKVLQFSAFSSAPKISEAGNYVFRNAPTDNDGGKLDAQLLSQRYKKIAIISESTDYSAGIHQILTDLLPKSGVSIVDDESYKGETKDFRTLLAKVKATNPEAIYFNPGTSPQAAGLLVKQARELGIKQPAYYNFMMGGAEAIKSAGGAAEGVIFSDVSDLPQGSKDLLSQYRAKYNSDPASEYELGSSYDRVMILVQAMKAVGTDPSKVKDYFYSMKNYDGMVGSYHFDQNGDVVGVGFSHFIVKDGKKTPYNP